MDEALILQLVKDKLLIRTSTARDSYIGSIIKSIVNEMQDEQGIVLDAANYTQVMFIVDYAEWRYSNKSESMPRNLQFRLHNIMIHNAEVVV